MSGTTVYLLGVLTPFVVFGAAWLGGCLFVWCHDFWKGWNTAFRRYKFVPHLRNDLPNKWVNLSLGRDGEGGGFAIGRAGKRGFYFGFKHPEWLLRFIPNPIGPQEESQP